MNERGKAALAGIVALFAVIGITALATVPLPVQADVVDVTTTWNIPVSIAFSVSFPFSNTNITFSPSSATFSLENASLQTDAISSYNTTNDGNVNIDVDALFMANFPSGVTLFETCTASASDAPSGTCYTWTDSNETTNNQTIITNLAPAGQEDLWAWSTGTNVVGGYTEVTYRLTSSAT